MTSISEISQAAGTTTSSDSSTAIESQTRVQNADGSVTTTTVYEDGTTRETTTAPNPAKAAATQVQESASSELETGSTSSEHAVSLTV